MNATVASVIFLFFLPATLPAELQDPPANKIDSSKSTPKESEPQAVSVVPQEFVIGPEDILTINVWKEPELSTRAVVRPDGKITLPLISEIQASGLTSKQLQELIQEKLKEFISAPVVSVTVSEIKSQVVYVMGQVGQPGPHPFGTPLTVLELLARAGGFREYAKTKKISIIRKEGDRQIQLFFNYNDFIEGKNLKQNIILKNGDVVVVP